MKKYIVIIGFLTSFGSAFANEAIQEKEKVETTIEMPFALPPTPCYIVHHGRCKIKDGVKRVKIVFDAPTVMICRVNKYIVTTTTYCKGKVVIKKTRV